MCISFNYDLIVPSFVTELSKSYFIVVNRWRSQVSEKISSPLRLLRRYNIIMLLILKYNEAFFFQDVHSQIPLYMNCTQGRCLCVNAHINRDLYCPLESLQSSL